MSRKSILLCILFALFASGCAASSKHMQPVEIGQNESILREEQAAIVFFRDTTFGGAIQAPIVEEIGADIAFVGIVSANTKILHITTPGKHTFVVGGESSNMLEADLASKKFYYVRVNPKLGLWKARFALEPVVVADENLQKDLSGCKWQTSGPSAQQWFIANKPNLKDKADAAREKDGAVLKPEEGSDILLR